MLGKVCLKRLRFVLYAVLFFLLTLDITNRTGDGLIATVCIWLALPLAFIAMVWWIYACVRDTVRLLRGWRRAGGCADVGGVCRLVGAG